MNAAAHRMFVRALALMAFALLTLVVTTAAHAVIVRTSVAYRPYHPVARTAAVVGTAVVVGSVVRSLPPACTTTIVGNVTYQQCGSTWYRPAYAGTSVSYTVVAPPR